MEEFYISLWDNMDYMGDRKRCLKEGKTVANTQHLLACEIVEEDESKVVLSYADWQCGQIHVQLWGRM